MSNHSNATPHVSKSINHTISDALRRRAESIIKDKSIDGGTRAFIRYGLEINDPWLPELVRRVDAGETITDNLNVLQTSEEKIAGLTDIICRAGDESAAALLVLMATLEMPHTRKHLRIRRNTCLYSLR